MVLKPAKFLTLTQTKIYTWLIILKVKQVVIYFNLIFFLLDSYFRLGSNESYLGNLTSNSSQLAFDETKL